MADGSHANNRSRWQSMVDRELAISRKRRRRRWTIVFVIALVVLLASLAALGVIAFSYFQGQQKYDEIAEIADVDLPDASDEVDLGSLTVDWDALRKANPDIVAWIFMPGTVINYPVVQGEDNEHYLSYDFDGEQGWLADYGAIFLDYRNDPRFVDPVNFIYGHHMNDGSMFATISTLEDQEAFDANRVAYLLTPQGNYKLRSYALVHCLDEDPIVEVSFPQRKDKIAYLQDKIDRSLAKAEDAPKAEDIGQTFALATCDSYSSGRDILFMYVEDENVEGLTGEVGLDANEESTWFVDELETKG